MEVTIYTSIEEAWEELEQVPSYAERFVPGDGPVLISVELCSACGHWHAPEDACPVLMEA